MSYATRSSSPPSLVEWGLEQQDTRFVRIPSTLHIRYAYLSDNCLDEALANDNVEVVEYAAEIEFDEDGYFARFGSEGGDDGYYGDA